MTDQDRDGSHIKGLGINLFEDQWPSLTKIQDFIGFMNTPILKARKADKELLFYNDGEYEQWKKDTPASEVAKWKIKYYKGLGTSTGKEFREYFENKKIVGFEYDSVTSKNAIDMVFNDKRADDRKDWLAKYDRESYLDTSQKSVTYDQFIDKELIHFSKYDCDRSIPNLMDGLKISLRKILYSAFKRHLTQEIKVAQFSGYVSEHSGYHHGEASLNAAIVGMAQNYVGSNNINLLLPLGQFGTRIRGGQDSASERYIFTALNRLTRTIFPQQDDSVLKYLDDDGLLVEPIYYAPILPMVLVNGSKGIGTGFSTDIMCYDPLEIVAYLKEKLNNTSGSVVSTLYEFKPYWEGFQGSITKISESKYLIKGLYQKLGNDKIRVTELPVGFWTEKFKEHLESLLEPVDKAGKKLTPLIKDYDDMSKDTNVDFTITFSKGKIEELEQTVLDHGCNGLEKLLKLYTTNTTTNMHLFDASDKLKKYETVQEIIDDYFLTRLELYSKRKENLIEVLTKELVLLSNKKRYILENLDGVIDLRKKAKVEINALLKERGYDVLDEDEDYKYLVKMPMDSVCQENVNRLEKDHSSKEQELKLTQSKTIQQMWFEELDVFRQQYLEYKEDRERASNSNPSSKKEGKSGEKKKLKIVKKG
jgi:DNA topoisomerase-2